MDLNRKSQALMASCWRGVGERSWLEIFKLLAPETLCVCRSVCKGWNSLISSASFIRYHHSFAALSTPDQKTYIRFPNNFGSGNPFSLQFPNRQDPNVILDSDLRFPFQFLGDVKARHAIHFSNVREEYIPSVKFVCVDVVNGIVCLSFSLDPCFDSIILWNPSIHKFISLPCLPYHPPLPPTNPFLASRARWFSHVVGFGYDGTDFIVVRIWIPNSLVQHTHGSMLPPTCEVYSAQKGLWKTLDLGSDDIIRSCQFSSRFSAYSRMSCFVATSLHWLVSAVHDPSKLSVLMFDLKPKN